MTRWTLGLGLLAMGCASDGGLTDAPPPVRRGGLAVRLVVAPPVEEPGDACEDTDDDDDDQEDDEELGVRSVQFERIGLGLDELRLTLDDERSFLVPVDRDLDLVGAATRDDEIVLDLELADYRDAVVELVARSGDRPALIASGVACVTNDDVERSQSLRLEVPDEIAFTSDPVRLVIGDGPDPRVSLGLQVDRWLAGLAPPSDLETWSLEPGAVGYEALLDNLRSAIVTEVD